MKETRTDWTAMEGNTEEKIKRWSIYEMYRGGGEWSGYMAAHSCQ